MPARAERRPRAKGGKPEAPRKPKPAPKPAPGKPPRGVVVGVGLATVDLLCVSPRLDERIIELSVFSMQGGGSAANTLATVAVLGARSRFFGRIGDDHFGSFVGGALEQLGVDISLMNVERGKMSPVSIVQVDEFTRRRKILFTSGDTSSLSPRDLPQRLLQNASVLCIDGYQPALQAAVAEKAREKGITVVLNAGHLVGGMGELLALADVVIGSERFASEFAPSDNVEKSLREITRLGPRVAVITLGNEGAVALEGDKLVQQEPIDVFVADTTGAGDVFCGAFAYATAAAWPLEEALPFANAAAGLKCRTLGSRAGLPSLAEVMSAWKQGLG
jgi:sulfofructose kinase